MKRIVVLRYIIISFLFVFIMSSNAQEIVTDTLSKGKNEFYHSPQRAAMYSAVLPGLGQLYNKQYWKIPVLYAGIATCIYFIDMNYTNYIMFKDYYIDYLNGGDKYKEYRNWSDPYGAITYYKDNYRRWLELSIISIFGVYVLNIIDATVFGYMFEFDISNDLTFRFEPSLFRNVNCSNALGVRCLVKF